MQEKLQYNSHRAAGICGGPQTKMLDLDSGIFSIVRQMYSSVYQHYYIYVVLANIASDWRSPAVWKM
jgi:hypothetical protein